MVNDSLSRLFEPQSGRLAVLRDSTLLDTRRATVTVIRPKKHLYVVINNPDKDDEAVSPVIAVVLLLGLVTILGAVAAAQAFGAVQIGGELPEAGIDVEVSCGETGGKLTVILTVVDTGNVDSLKIDQTEIRENPGYEPIENPDPSVNDWVALPASSGEDYRGQGWEIDGSNVDGITYTGTDDRVHHDVDGTRLVVIGTADGNEASVEDVSVPPCP